VYIGTYTSIFLYTGEGLENKLILTTDDHCICPGDILTYECTVIGSQLGTTVWHGTAFDCIYNSGEISLLHSAYADSEDSVLRAYGKCNNGLIAAQSLSVVDSLCYTSQLNITVSADVIGKSIECHYDDSNTTTLQLVGATNIITGKSIKVLASMTITA
jgi:hypothetical protein